MSRKRIKVTGYSFKVVGRNLVEVFNKVYIPSTQKSKKVSLGVFRLLPFPSTKSIGKKMKENTDKKWFVSLNIPQDLNTTRMKEIDVGEIGFADLGKLGVKSPYELDLAEMFFKGTR